ncbi:hypothetical protein [uncultured Alistipes sp.]|uniref:hypothetical protein n=1 Tax=uncultured Alistipes sp. TaxID=538949 RepID=UPI002612F0F3|nr:hypothetical protein [uncultured Alistipes sp.]
MDKEQQRPSAPEPAGSNSSSREQQAGQIMQQLVAEGFLAPDEAAEITFSETAFICIPSNNGQKK